MIATPLDLICIFLLLCWFFYGLRIQQTMRQILEAGREQERSMREFWQSFADSQKAALLLTQDMEDAKTHLCQEREKVNRIIAELQIARDRIQDQVEEQMKGAGRRPA